VLARLIGEVGFPFPPPCIAAGLAVVEADYQTALGAIPDGEAKAKGIGLGEAAAAAILALRAHDGADTLLLDFAYPQGSEPGEYRFTPGFEFAFAPGWGSVTSFVPDNRDAGVRRPFRLTSRKYLADFNEVKRLGGDGVTTPSARTAEQTEIALFWIESSPLQWNRIARAASTGAGLDEWENARLFGLLNMALADGYVATFAAKYHYNFWRPVTAIRNGDTDGNDATERDASWAPFIDTPMHPEYPCAHCVIAAAVGTVLQADIGSGPVPVLSTSSPTAKGATRTWTSTADFMQAFYGHLQGGSTKARAVQAATLEVRERYRHPFYWAGFIQSGAWEPLR